MKQEPIRIVRHFACTGGTVLCKALQAQPNVRVLSELDPFSTIHQDQSKPRFSPTSLIDLAASGSSPLDNKTKRRMFLAEFRELYDSFAFAGTRVVVREHTHGLYCTKRDWRDEFTLNKALGSSYALRKIVTVRHPLHSWMSLNKNRWVQFEPPTIAEYARRYLAFLEDCASDELFRYEDFVVEPQSVVVKMCEALNLVHNEHWQDLMPIINMTGDSGRAGADIRVRPMQEVPKESLRRALKSKYYNTLCDRLGYLPDLS